MRSPGGLGLLARLIEGDTRREAQMPGVAPLVLVLLDVGLAVLQIGRIVQQPDGTLTATPLVEVSDCLIGDAGHRHGKAIVYWS